MFCILVIYYTNKIKFKPNGLSKLLSHNIPFSCQFGMLFFLRCNSNPDKMFAFTVTYRREVARLRISSHRLNIEFGRYTKKTGDEIHFLLVCLK